MTTWLVTGATGFIGTKLVLGALERGFRVRAVARGIRRRPWPVRPNASLHALDCCENRGWDDACVGVDTVVHCAPAPAACLALAARAANVRRFVFLSTVDVITSHSRSGPLVESDQAMPATSYAAFKRATELELQALLSAGRPELVILRPPLVHGARARGNFGRLMALVRRGWPLPFARTNNLRSFVGVANLCDAVFSAARAPGCANRTFHVTDEPPIGTRELVVLLAEALGVPCRLFGVPDRATRHLALTRKLFGDFVVDGSRFRDAAGWTQPISLHDGLRRAAMQSVP